LVLPEPAGAVRGEPPTPGAETPNPDAEPGIGALVRRIEAFQRARREGAPAPHPSIAASAGNLAPATRCDFESDAHGAIVWADPVLAPLLVGLTLGAANSGSVAELDLRSTRTMDRHLPLTGGRLTIAGAERVGGEWRIDAAPVFTAVSGSFAGYRGRIQRPVTAAPLVSADSTHDRMRQVLHELRTPVNAIQGFAEIIQQQLFAPVPNEYRALAAAIAVDAARLLAGFEELDRLARLESGDLELAEGSCDLREAVAQLLRRLEGVLRPRSARMILAVSGSPFTVGLERAQALQLAWRLLATLAGAVAPGEVIELALSGDGEAVTLHADLPAALLEQTDLFTAAAPAQARAVSAGMFGSGFAFRLARAEAAAVGGTLLRNHERITLQLPALTDPGPAHTVVAHG
jgi:signal transduction histidine kinase